LEGKIEVYNFEVEKFHTCLVGSIGAVVHNKCSENNPYLVAWRKHKANGGSGLGFNMEGEASDQEFLDFIGSPEGQQYLNEYGEAAQGVNGSLFSWSVGGILKWADEQVSGAANNQQNNIQLYSRVQDVLGKKYQAKAETITSIKNTGLLDSLQKVSPGTWQKVYEAGINNGKRIEVHYFRNINTGKVFDVKIKYNYWHQKPFKNIP
jgi:hypothetical protein